MRNKFESFIYFVKMAIHFSFFITLVFFFGGGGDFLYFTFFFQDFAILHLWMVFGSFAILSVCILWRPVWQDSRRWITRMSARMLHLVKGLLSVPPIVRRRNSELYLHNWENFFTNTAEYQREIMVNFYTAMQGCASFWKKQSYLGRRALNLGYLNFANCY